MLLTEYDERKHMKDTYKEGYESGEQALCMLVNKLIEDGRTAEVAMAVADKEVRTRLYKEYKIVDL